MTKLMAFIGKNESLRFGGVDAGRIFFSLAEKTNFKENPIEHSLIDRFVGK